MTDSDRLSARAAEIADSENERLLEPHHRHRRRSTSARVEHMPLGVPSSFQAWRPVPDLPRARGRAASVWDVDGNEYLDFHSGFGSMVVGHAHPKVVEAIDARPRAPARTSPRRPRPPCASPRSCAGASSSSTVRFANSGTEATMDAIRVARAATGRDAHREDRGLVPRSPRPGDVLGGARTPTSMGGREAPATTPMSNGIPAVMAEYTHVVPFNDLEVLSSAARRARRRDRVPDPRAGDDEHRHLPARARLPPGPRATCCTSTARC